MEVALFIVAWLAVGALGSFLTFWFWWRDQLDLTTSELPVAGLVALSGPIGLGVGIVFTCVSLIRRLRFVRDMRSVVIAARRS